MKFKQTIKENQEDRKDRLSLSKSMKVHVVQDKTKYNRKKNKKINIEE